MISRKQVHKVFNHSFIRFLHLIWKKRTHNLSR